MNIWLTYVQDGEMTFENITKEDILSGTDAVTIADLTTQQIIEGSLLHYYPTVKLVGEEDIPKEDYKVVDVNKSLLVDFAVPEGFNVQIPAEDIVIYVDPLDGTKDYVLGDVFCAMTLIGISVRGRALGGVINSPFWNEGNGRLLWAYAGLGFSDSSPLSEEEKALNATRNEFTLVTTKVHGSEQLEQMIKLMQPDKVVRVGGAGYKILTVIDKKSDLYAYPTKGTKKWDTCAPEAILAYCGGYLTDFSGTLIDYANTVDVFNKGILAASQLSDHTSYCEKVKSMNSV